MRGQLFVRPSNEWMRAQYVDGLVNANALARLVGCDGKTLWAWLKQAGIPTRRRGYGDPGVHFKTGPRPLSRGRRMSDEQREKVRAATILRKGVPYLINGVHWMKATGRKPANWKGGITAERQTFYRSAEWKECIKKVWGRDGKVCQRCSKSLAGQPHAIHHIDSFMIVDRRCELDNLILLCRPCHLWVHSKLNVARELLGAGQEFGIPPIMRAAEQPA